MKRISDRRRPGWIVMLAIVAGVALVLAASEPEQIDEAPLAGLSRDLVVSFTGDQPERCVFAAPGRELCTWELPGRLFRPGENPLITGRVNLVCELPIDAPLDDDIQSGACRAHPNRAGTGEGLPAVSAAPRPGARSPALELARARTVTDISHLVGEGPQRCRTRRDDQVCDWEIRQPEPAHPDLANLAQAGGDPVRLRCLLPLDGSKRRPSSCDVRRID